MLLFELLQVALGHRKELSYSPSEKEWYEVYNLAKKHALQGIAYVAIEILPTHQRPPRQLLLQWYAIVEHIKTINEQLNHNALEISHKFLNEGFRNVILKGQGVAQYYKTANLHEYRTPGDIDIWLDGSRKEILKYISRSKCDCKIVYHHVDIPKINGVEVEVHFTPSWMNNYFTNSKLQYFFEINKEILFSNNGVADEIPTPNAAFNRVYLLVHIFRHLFHEGIGLRQLLDYYFTLKQGFTEDEKRETMLILTQLKMQRFTQSVMWIMQSVFGLDESFLLTTPNDVDGRFLLEEIMKSGNFGQSDLLIIRNSSDSDLSHGLRKIKRTLRFIRSYPSEVIWGPLFKIWHFFWRQRITSFYRKLKNEI